MEQHQSARGPQRYARPVADGSMDPAASERLARAQVLVVGASGAGAAAAGHLAAAGVGHLSVADGRAVSPADLALQTLHFAADVASNRAESLCAKLGFLNPGVQADAYPVAVEEANAAAIAEGHDLVVDCAGDPLAAAALNDACIALSLPLIRADTSAGFAAVAALWPGAGPCLVCALPTERSVAAGAEPLGPHAAPGPLQGIAGAAVAAEAIAALVSGSTVATVRVIETASSLRVRESAVVRDPACSACSAPSEAGSRPPAQAVEVET